MTTPRRRWTTPRLAAAMALVLAGCAPADTPSPSVAESASATGATVTVHVVDSSFGPNITVADGTDGQLVEDWLFDLVLEPGASDSYTFDEPGTYPVTCIVHPLMNMTITVE